MPVWRARRSWGVLLVPGLALLLATSLAACGDSSDANPSPTPSEAASQAAIPVAPPEPEPLHLPGTVSPADLPPSETAAAVTAAAPATALAVTPGTDRDFDPVIPPAPPSPPAIVPITPTPTGPPRLVGVVGPLLVFSSPVGVERRTGDHVIGNRRVSLYEIETDQYWDAFDYVFSRHRWGRDDGRSRVQHAGTQLIVWSRDQIARVTLTGQVETVLFEDAAIQAFAVSPDGTHVAVLYGEPSTLIVLDTATGEERLRVASSDLDPQPLRDNWSREQLRLGTWYADGTALSITAYNVRLVSFPRDPDTSGSQEPIVALVDNARTAILGLDGSVRVLPEDWWPLSPDLRYAIRRGSVIKAGKYSPGNIWDRWDIVDVETEELRWTITDENGIREPFLVGHGGYWLGESQYVAFHVPFKGDRILDIGTGEVRAVTLAAQQALASGICHRSVATQIAWSAFPHPCDLWETYHGLIKAPRRFLLRGIILREEIVSTPVPPSPPARETMVGPLFLYEVGGPYEAVMDRIGGIRHVPTRRVMAYDEGTGRRWLVFRYRTRTVGGQPGLIQIAPDGFVVSTDQGLRYVAFDGQTTPLRGGVIEWRRPIASLRQQLGPWDYQVSPDGQKVAVSFDDQIAVFDLPSGDAILRVPEDDLVALWEEKRPRRSEERYGACTWDLFQVLYAGNPSCYVVGLNTASAWAPDSSWGADSETILIRFGDSGGDDFGWVGAGTITLDGAITILDEREHPKVLEPASESRGGYDCREPAFPCRILLDGEVVGEGRWPTIIGVVELD